MKFTWQVLLSSSSIREKCWIDTHSRPVSDEVWQLYQFWLEQYGERHTLIEWDLDIPQPEVLLAEAAKASEQLNQWQAAKRKVS